MLRENIFDWSRRRIYDDDRLSPPSDLCGVPLRATPSGPLQSSSSVFTPPKQPLSYFESDSTCVHEDIEESLTSVKVKAIMERMIREENELHYRSTQKLLQEQREEERREEEGRGEGRWGEKREGGDRTREWREEGTGPELRREKGEKQGIRKETKRKGRRDRRGEQRDGYVENLLHLFSQYLSHQVFKLHSSKTSVKALFHQFLTLRKKGRNDLNLGFLMRRRKIIKKKKEEEERRRKNIKIYSILGAKLGRYCDRTFRIFHKKNLLSSPSSPPHLRVDPKHYSAANSLLPNIRDCSPPLSSPLPSSPSHSSLSPSPKDTSRSYLNYSSASLLSPEGGDAEHFHFSPASLLYNDRRSPCLIRYPASAERAVSSPPLTSPLFSSTPPSPHNHSLKVSSTPLLSSPSPSPSPVVTETRNNYLMQKYPLSLLEASLLDAYGSQSQVLPFSSKNKKLKDVSLPVRERKLPSPPSSPSLNLEVKPLLTTPVIAECSSEPLSFARFYFDYCHGRQISSSDSLLLLPEVKEKNGEERRGEERRGEERGVGGEEERITEEKCSEESKGEERKAEERGKEEREEKIIMRIERDFSFPDDVKVEFQSVYHHMKTNDSYASNFLGCVEWINFQQLMSVFHLAESVEAMEL